MEKENIQLYSEDYYEALKIVSKWPNWKKEYANNCILIGKYAKKYHYILMMVILQIKNMIHCKSMRNWFYT